MKLERFCCKLKLENLVLIEALVGLLCTFGSPPQCLASSYWTQSNSSGAAEQVKLSEILIPLSATANQEEAAAAEKEANQILDRLRGGASFEQEAREHSKGPTASRGGNIGYFNRGVLATSIQERVFSLKVGGLTDPIRTREGFVILKVTEHPTSRVKDSGLEGVVDILSDTKGIDVGPYLSSAIELIRRNWFNLIPPDARAPNYKYGAVAVMFSIRQDGVIEDMKLASSSGTVAFDRAAWGAITASSPLKPLPAGFKKDFLTVRFRFYYNPNRIAPELLDSASGKSN